MAITIFSLIVFVKLSARGSAKQPLVNLSGKLAQVQNSPLKSI